MRRPESDKRFRELLHNKEVFLSFLRSYAMVLLVPFLVSVLFYYISGSETERYAVQLNNQVLVSASESMDQHLLEVGNIANEIVCTSAVRNFHNNTSGFAYPNAYRMVEVRDSLEAYSLVQSFVYRYFLFFNNSRIVINKTLIYGYDDFFQNYLLLGDESETFVSALENQTLRVGLIPARDMTMLKESGRYLSLVQPLFARGNGYLMILIDENSVASLFRNINLGATGAVYIAEGSGEILTSSLGDACDLDELYQATIGHVIDNPAEKSYHINTANGEMLVNHLYTATNGLTYVSIQPISVIMERVNVYRNLMIACLCASLLIGLLLCLWQARRISTPLTAIMSAVGMHGDDSATALANVQDMIRTLQADNTHLQQLASEHRTLLRSSFTSRLLRGSFSSDAEASRVCQYVYPECMPFERAHVLLFHLQPLDSPESDDTPLKLLGSMKMVLKELLDRRLKNPLYYDVDEETLALIVFNLNHAALETLYAELYGEFTPYMRESVHTYVGNAVTPPLPKIARSFEQARASMTMHSLAPQPSDKALIWPEASTGAVQFFYPPDVSYRLTDAVTHGDRIVVDQTLDELFQVNFVERPITPAVGRLFISELLSTAVNCLPLLRNRTELGDEKCNEYLTAIHEASPKRQFGLLRDFYHVLTRSAEFTRQEGGAEQIAQVIDYLNGHFRDSDLSLASIADTFALNASVLSTSFKQQTGKNLSAYLEDLRIQEAQRLLRTTDMTINRIAEEVGYLSANTFCRAFRRNTGYNTSTYKTMNEPHGAQEE